MAEELNTDTPEQQETPAVQSVMSAQPKTLSVADVKSKIDTQTPLYSNEYLPSAPKNMSAKGFYGQFRGYGGASVYSQPPFASSLSTVQGTAYLPEQPSFIESPTQSQQTINKTEPIISEQTFGDDSVTDFSADSDYDQLGTIIDTEYEDAFSLLPDIDYNKDLIPQFTEKFADLNEYFDTEYGIDFTDFEKTLEDIGFKITSSLNEGVDAVNETIEEASETLSSYLTADGVSKAVQDISSKFMDNLATFGENVTNLGNPEKLTESIDYFTNTFKDTIVSNTLSYSLQKLFNVGSVYTMPLGIIATAVLGDDADGRIGQAGYTNVGYSSSDSLLGKTADELSKMDEQSTIVGFVQGVAVDKDGNVMSQPRFTATTVTEQPIIHRVSGIPTMAKYGTGKKLQDYIRDYFNKYGLDHRDKSKIVGENKIKNLIGSQGEDDLLGDISKDYGQDDPRGQDDTTSIAQIRSDIEAAQQAVAEEEAASFTDFMSSVESSPVTTEEQAGDSGSDGGVDTGGTGGTDAENDAGGWW